MLPHMHLSISTYGLSPVTDTVGVTWLQDQAKPDYNSLLIQYMNAAMIRPVGIVRSVLHSFYLEICLVLWFPERIQNT